MGEEGLWTSEVGLLRLMGHKYESNSLFLRKSYTNSRKQCIRLIFERFCSLGNTIVPVCKVILRVIRLTIMRTSLSPTLGELTY